MIPRAVLLRPGDDVLDGLDLVDAAMADPGVALVLQLDVELLRIHRRTADGWDLERFSLERWSTE